VNDEKTGLCREGTEKRPLKKLNRRKDRECAKWKNREDYICAKYKWREKIIRVIKESFLQDAIIARHPSRLGWAFNPLCRSSLDRSTGLRPRYGHHPLPLRSTLSWYRRVRTTCWKHSRGRPRSSWCYLGWFCIPEGGAPWTYQASPLTSSSCGSRPW